MYEASISAALTGTVTAAMTSTTTTTTTLPPGGAVSGTLNLSSVAGLAIGDYLDVYWTGANPNPISGSLYGATIEDISGTQIFFNGGTLWSVGTSFPSNGTTITCMVPIAVPVVFTGANLQSWAAYGDQPCTFVLDTATRANTWARVIPIAAGVDHWETPGPVANPVSGSSITQCFVSHADSTGSRTLRFGAIVNP